MGMLIVLLGKTLHIHILTSVGDSHDIESTKDEMMKANPNLERSVTVQQSMEKMFTILLRLQEGGTTPGKI